MSSDALHSVEVTIAPRISSLSDRAIRLEALRDRLRLDETRLQEEIQELTTTIDKLTKVLELFRMLMDLLLVKQVKAIEEVITEGLQTIFHDQDLHFESDIGVKWNKVSVDFKIREGDKEDPLAIRGSPLDTFGGGPASVASLLLRTLTLLRLKRYPFLILDEALFAVSEDYVSATGALLKTLSEKMGVQLLMITHNTNYLGHATQKYQGTLATQDGRPQLRLRGLQ